MNRKVVASLALPASLALTLGLTACQVGSSPETAASTAGATEPTVTRSATTESATEESSPSGALAERDEAPTPDAAPTSAKDLAEGDCFNTSSGDSTDTGQIGNVDVVDCSEPHVYEVFASGELEGQDLSDRPSEEEMKTRASEICSAEVFANYVGSPYETSKFEASYLSPSAIGWVAGERFIRCILETADQAEVTGSARGSGQ